MFTNHTRTHRIGVCLPLVLLLFLMSFVTMAGEVAVTSVTACQRYPWNGLVDIVVTIEGTADDVSAARYKFLSTNSATNVEIPVEHITRNGADIGSGNTWTSRFVWDAKADVGAVKIEDVLLFVGAKILGGVQLWENGPCWAECNVGATQPEECGYYFWWGDTVGYERVGASWNASNGSRSGFSFKEGNCSTYGSIRTSDLLATQDAATEHLGAPWRMPTSAELVDLFNNCTTSWTMRNGVYGRLVTGKGAFVSKSIFLPAAGYGKDTNLVNHGSRGYYWTSTPSADDSWNKWCSWLLKFDSSEFGRSSSWEPYRYCGQSVRPLRGFNDESIASASGVVTHLALDCREGVRKAAKEGECLHYDVSWYEKAAQIRISDNEKVIGVGTIGDFAWHPELSSSTRHLVKLEALNGDLVVATETIEFEDNLLFEVKSVKAHQRYPWNGLVDIVMEIEGSASDVESAESSIVATVGETGEIIPVEHITRNGGDVGSYGSWTRSFIWNAAADVSADRVEDVVLTADARMGREGVRLWENGPYWAECNVGAKKPDEAGYRFWWGDTIGYIRKSGTYSVDWSYKWYKDVTWVSSEGYSPSSSPFSSSSCSTCWYDYRALQSLGYIDGAGNLVAAHDAATAHLGAPWRMPTSKEFTALFANCITSVESGGLRIRGKGSYSGNSIFLPAAGWGVDSYEYYNNGNSNGGYWSSTPTLGSKGSDAKMLRSSDAQSLSQSRYYGLSVRPVRGVTNINGVTTHLSLDFKTDVRMVFSAGEKLFYDVNWYSGANQIRITDNGNVVVIGTAGCFTWHPGTHSDTPHVVKLEALMGDQVVATEIAEFSLGYARNVVARQLWPHKKVEVCYELAEDVIAVGEELESVLMCGDMTSVPELVFMSGTGEPRVGYKGADERGAMIRGSGSFYLNKDDSTICCTVSNVTQVSFRWKVVDSRGDDLSFYVDGSEIRFTSKSDEWKQETVSLNRMASHELKWQYAENHVFGQYNSYGGYIDSVAVKQTTDARTVFGDKHSTAGAHRVVWDMEADGEIFDRNDLPFAVKVAETIGVTTGIVVNTSAAVADGMSVENDILLAYSPIDAGHVSLCVNGREILSSDESGVVVWSAKRPGTYVHTHQAGDRVFARTVIYHGKGDEKEIEVGWLDRSVSQLFPAIYASVTNIVIAPTVTWLPEGAFDGCKSLGDGVIIQDGCVLGVNGVCPKHVVMPEGVRLIADGAFRDCDDLESVILPSTLKYIGKDAFRGCTSLEYVELPEGLGDVGEGAFRDCTWMQEVEFPSSLTNIGKMAFANCTMLDGVECFDGLESVGEGAFSNCWRMLSVALPVTVNEIGERAFFNCKSVLGVSVPTHVDTIAHLFPSVYQTLQSVSVAEGETELVAGFFGGCKMLQEIVLSNAIREIPNSTFEGCTELIRVWLPSELLKIGNRAFYGCGKLSAIEFPSGLISIGDYAFYGCGRICELKFPDGLVEIGADAFNGLPNVLGIACPVSVKKIGARAFKGVWNDLEINLPEGLKSLGADAFANCASIRRVALPVLATPIKSAFPDAFTQIESVKILGQPEVILKDFCRDIAKLTDIQIPASVTNIEGYAFSGLSNLVGVELPSGLCTIGEYAFNGDARLATIALPQSVESVGYRAFYGCSNVRSVSCSGELGTMSTLFPSAYTQITSVSINEGTTRLIDDLLFGCTKLSDVDLPAGIIEIGARAFKNCSALAAFGVPNGVVTLGNDVFYGCTGLTSLSLPEGLENIPSGAFQNCRAISSLVIPASVDYIGADAFSGCTALKSVSYLGSCPEFDSACYSGTPSDLSSYVVFGSRGWDGIPTSRTLPESWPTANARAITYWEPNTFDAMFDGNGGTPSASVVVQTTGMTYVLPEENPEMLGARFDGWWTQPVNGGRIKSTTKVEVTRAQTFYAHWKYNGYSVRFDANGGVGEMEGQVMTVNTPVELAPNRYLRKGYRFEGWALSSDGEVAFVDGEEVENLSFEHNAVVPLYAVWAEQPWDAADYLNVSGRAFAFDGDAEWVADDEVSHDGIGSMRSGVIAAADEGKKTTSVMQTTVVGTGSGSFWWKVDCEPADGSDYFDYCAFFVDGTEVAKIAGTEDWAKVDYVVTGEGEHVLKWVFTRDDWDEDESLYGNTAWVDEFEWVPTPVTLSFDAGGADGEVPASVTKYAGYEMSLPSPSMLTKDGMVFAGWSDGVNVLRSGDAYMFGSVDAVLCAVWEEKTWTLEEAASLTGLTIVTGGDANWAVDLEKNYDGVASIRSGVVSDDQQTWVSIDVVGSGTVAFRAFVSGEFYRGKKCDYLKFEVDGVEEFSSYDANWSNVVVKVSGLGSHTLKWTYLKNASKSVGDDCAWLDEIVWDPDAETEIVPTIADLVDLFGAESDVVTEIKDEAQLVAFNQFLKDCAIASASDMSAGQKTWAYQSFKLSEIMTVPQLFEVEPVLKFDDIELNDGNLALTVSLHIGSETVELSKDKLAETIRVGTSLDAIVDVPRVVISPSTDGELLTYIIELPQGDQGFVKLLVD